MVSCRKVLSVEVAGQELVVRTGRRRRVNVGDVGPLEHRRRRHDEGDDPWRPRDALEGPFSFVVRFSGVPMRMPAGDEVETHETGQPS